tara:strand:- start:2380 stop:3087 length:708 start_codon:yes stop_codon:yes gene_type:complete
MNGCLVIDDRENPKLQNSLLMVLGDRSISPQGMGVVRRLESADYVIGDWGIEAKEINDLYRSIVGQGRNRTVTDQLADLVTSYETPMLVVYGTELKPYFRKRVSRQRYVKEIARMTRVIRQYKIDLYRRFPTIKYLEFTTMGDFIDFLTSATMQNKIASVPQGRIPKKHDDPRIQVLASLPGISVVMAEELLERFGSIPGILRKRTTQSDLMAVRGVGRTRAKMILSLRDDYSIE